jgi:hypothetical protein
MVSLSFFTLKTFIDGQKIDNTYLSICIFNDDNKKAQQTLNAFERDKKAFCSNSLLPKVSYDRQ